MDDQKQLGPEKGPTRGTGFKIPPEARMGECVACKESFWWVEIAQGRWRLLEADGRLHGCVDYQRRRAELTETRNL